MDVNNYNTTTTSNHEKQITYLHREFNHPFPTIRLKCVSSKEIEVITKSLKITNSHGYDGIITKILIMSIQYISSPLTHLCNKMLYSETFPNRLKFSEVKPIFIKEDKSDTANYRPISLHHFQRFLKRLFILDYISI
jgi:hypothetical protein